MLYTQGSSSLQLKSATYNTVHNTGVILGLLDHCMDSQIRLLAGMGACEQARVADIVQIKGWFDVLDCRVWALIVLQCRLHQSYELRHLSNNIHPVFVGRRNGQSASTCHHFRILTIDGINLPACVCLSFSSFSPSLALSLFFLSFLLSLIKNQFPECTCVTLKIMR